MATPIIWTGSGSEVSGNTPFGFYDNEISFVSDSKASAVWAARRLGYPIVDIELDSNNFYAAFEESVTEYSAIVNNFNIKENLLTLQGSPSGSNLTGRQIRGGLGRIIKLSEFYGAEVGAGGDVDWKVGSINVVADTQVYDLNVLWADVSESSNTIKIKRIFHNRIPASQKYFDPNYLQYSYAQQEFGFDSIGAGTTYMMRPVYEDLLRIQRIEIANQVRKSAYSFEIINNKLRLFPKPTSDYKLWFHYTVEHDVNLGYVSGSDGLGVITDHHNVPYQNMKYKLINSVGKQWIKKYFLATCKEMLGTIRSKYASVPIPNGDVTLDGDTLRIEANTEKDRLITDLKEILEASSRRSQLDSKSEEDENIQKIINKVPMQLYIG